MPRLTRAFYARPCLEVARDLVGCRLVHVLDDGRRVSGRLVEVEAYLGDGSDPGAHSHRGPTPRNRVMFGPPGVLYAYRSYGIHTCVNVVCEPEGRGAAVLLRALEPLEGVDVMRSLRGLEPSVDGRRARLVASGPGRLAQALGLRLDHNGRSAVGGGLYLLTRPAAWRGEVVRGPRVGLTQGAALPHRFSLADSPFVSAWRPGRLRRQAS